MASRIDHGRAKARRPRRFGERIDRNTRGTGPSRQWRNLRTEWDGEPFPVTTTRIKDGDTMEGMRAIDGNGHVPQAPEVEPDELTDFSLNYQLGHEAGYQLGRRDAVLDMIAAIAAQAQENLDKILAQLAERQAAA